jgi:hypothetical protein
MAKERPNSRKPKMTKAEFERSAADKKADAKEPARINKGRGVKK